ncbi:hypothetical protein FQN54_005064 [Arachnomyces sp. PD_36]|nr:hypothetical protein FQN54_005064 [Arachnomyces sp. PD_36]
MAIPHPPPVQPATATSATPILASSLLEDPPRTTSPERPTTRNYHPKGGWDLAPSILGDGDDDDEGGLVVGRATPSGVLAISGLKDNDEDVGDLALRILSKFLLRGSSSSGDDDGNRAYVIHPAHSATFSPERIYASIQSVALARGEEDVDSTGPLSRVEILRVFDFSEMSEAVGEVSDAVGRSSNASGGGGSGGDGGRKGPEETLIIIEGIDKFTKSVIEKSDVVRGNALLVVLLRRLGVLVRGRGKGRRVRVLIVNGVGVGGSGRATFVATPMKRVKTPGGRASVAAGKKVEVEAEGSGVEGGKASTSTETEEEEEVADTEDGDDTEAEDTTPPAAAATEPTPTPIQHSRPQPKYQNQNQHPSSIFLSNHVNYGRPSGLYMAFNKSLDQGIDTHILVSRVQGKRVVEVAKDRVGDGVGRWCVWEGG